MAPRKEGQPHKGWKTSARENTRRLRQIEKGQLKEENGLISSEESFPRYPGT